MEEWNKTKNIYETKEKAQKIALVIETTEGRLASSKKGPQYGVETKVEEDDKGWVVLWRNVLLPPTEQGCSGCGSCGSDSNHKNKDNAKDNKASKETAKILAFRPRQS